MRYVVGAALILIIGVGAAFFFLAKDAPLAGYLIGLFTGHIQSFYRKRT